MIGGRYRLGPKLGQGGMGAVYRAIDGKTGRAVALKLLIEADEKSLARFRREAHAAASLRHPHIVGLLDMDVDDPNGAYIVMELVDGQSLQSLLTSEGRLDEARAVAIGSQLFSALAHAHAAGLLHRDVKPGNILISRTDTIPDFLRLVDFGLAKHADPQQGGPAVTTMASMLGTPAYMPPEQMIGFQLDPRADIYSAGLVLYRMIAGVDPYAETGSDRISAVIAQRPGRPLLSVAPWTSPGIAALVDACIAPDKSRRPGSAAEVVDQLARRTQSSAARGGSNPSVDASAVATVGPPQPYASHSSFGPHALPDPGAPTAQPGSLHHHPTVGGPAPVAATVVHSPYGAPNAGSPGAFARPSTQASASRSGLVVMVAVLAVVAVGALGVAGFVLFANRHPAAATPDGDTVTDAAAALSDAGGGPSAAGSARGAPAASGKGVASAQRGTAHVVPSASAPGNAKAGGAAGSCFCVEARGGLRLCAVTHEPVCSCEAAVCKVPTVSTPDGANDSCPGGHRNFGGPGKRTGQPCTGFVSTFTGAGKFITGQNPRTGVLECSVCETPGRTPGVQGGKCTGFDNLGQAAEGTFDCR